MLGRDGDKEESMKVLAHMTYTTTILVEVPDDIPEKEQRSAACKAADAGFSMMDLEWAFSDFYRPAKEGEESYDMLEDGTKMTEWFDVG